jgi:hypothetical protein
MREFRPPVRPSGVRTALAIVVGLVIAVALVPLVLVAVGSQRTTYVLAGGTLVVDSGSWLDGRRSIPLAMVHEARAITLQGGRRTFGTAMPGHCAGRFEYADIGAVWQATDCSRAAVLVTTNDGDRPVVVTPPDREAFLQALDAGTEFRIELPPPSASGPRALLLIVIPAALIGAVLTAATLLLGPSRMVYRVGDGQLEVRTIFGRRAWPASSLRARGHSSRLQLRLAGTGVRGYYTGFYLADGKRTRVYATEAEGGVLLEGPARIFVSPDDREGFLAALRAEGATVEGA